MCRIIAQVQADTIQQAFNKMGGEGAIPAHFDPEIGDITIDFSTVLDEKKVCIYEALSTQLKWHAKLKLSRQIMNVHDHKI